ncbi:MAG: molecular chaperone GrpE [Candidatus Onthomonas sp.]
MVYLILGLIMAVLSAVLRLAAIFRLAIPLVYALVVPTIFHEWYYANQALAEGIWYGMLAVVVLSWLVSLGRKLLAIRRRRKKERELVQSLR